MPSVRAIANAVEVALFDAAPGAFVLCRHARRLDERSFIDILFVPRIPSVQTTRTDGQNSCRRERSA